MRMAATARSLASVVSTARRRGSKGRSTGAEGSLGRACFKASNLGAHTKRAVGLSALIAGGELGVPLDELEAAMVVGQLHLKRRTSEHEVGVTHSRINCTFQVLGSTYTPGADRRCPESLGPVARTRTWSSWRSLRVEKDLEYLLHIQQILL